MLWLGFFLRGCWVRRSCLHSNILIISLRPIHQMCLLKINWRPNILILWIDSWKWEGAGQRGRETFWIERDRTHDFPRHMSWEESREREKILLDSFSCCTMWLYDSCPPSTSPVYPSPLLRLRVSSSCQEPICFGFSQLLKTMNGLTWIISSRVLLSVIQTTTKINCLALATNPNSTIPIQSFLENIQQMKRKIEVI